MVEFLLFSVQLAGVVAALGISYAGLAWLRDRLLQPVLTRAVQPSFDRGGVSIMTRIVRS
jgi:hypothetical protein